MKSDYPDISKEVLCRLFGKTRHALYDHLWRQQDDTVKEEIILQLVPNIRAQVTAIRNPKASFPIGS